MKRYLYPYVVSLSITLPAIFGCNKTASPPEQEQDTRRIDIETESEAGTETTSESVSSSTDTGTTTPSSTESEPDSVWDSESASGTPGDTHTQTTAPPETATDTGTSTGTNTGTNTDGDTASEAGSDLSSDTGELPDCRSTLPEECDTLPHCLTISGNPIDREAGCFGPAEPVECIDPSEFEGCFSSLAMAIDSTGQCWYFTCLYIPASMIQVPPIKETMIETCGADVNSLNACEE
jgi:hypothetical protein